MRVIENYEENKRYNISLLEAIVLLEKSWRQVTSATIHNYFRRAVLSKDVLLEGKDANVEDEGNEENLPIVLWLEKHNVNVYPKDVTDYFKSYDDKEFFLVPLQMRTLYLKLTKRTTLKKT